VELLGVLTIIGILAALSSMAIKALSGSIGLTGAGDVTAAVFAFARQEAITKNTLTAVVVPTNTSLVTAAYRTLGVWEYSAASGAWQQASAWRMLPNGVVIDCHTDATDAVVTGTSSMPNSNYLLTGLTFPAMPTTISYHGTTLNAPSAPGTGDFAYQVFLPSGRLPPAPASSLTPSSYTLTLVEGFYASGASSPTYTHLKNGSGPPVNYVQYYFNIATGDIKIVRP
jgi:Tfp pilus assembly protein FimT